MDPKTSPDEPVTPEQSGDQNLNATPNTSFSPTPAQPPAAESAGPMPVPGVVTPMQDLPNRGRGKKLALVGGVVAVLVAAAAAYLVGFYLPNQPANVFATALERTGENYDKLASYLKDDSLAKKYKNGQANGTFKFKSADFSTDGSFESKGNTANGTFKADMGLVTTRLKVESMLKDAPNSESPDVYLKVSGIKGFGAQTGIPGIDSLDNQWIEIDHSLFDTVANQYADKKDGATQMPPKEDLEEAYNVLGQVGHKYLFTGDDKNAVFEMRKYVGEEAVEGRKTLHYKVGVNKDNYKKFAEELGRELDKTKLNAWVKENAGGQSLSAMVNTKEMANDADNVKADDTADLWVYADDKTVHKVRFSDRKNVQKYTEFGMGAQDTDKHPFFIKMKDTDMTVDLSASLDTRTHSIDFKASYEAGKGSKASSGSFVMTVKPHDGKVEVKAPTNTITLNEALSKIGLGAYLKMLTEGSLGQSNIEALPIQGLESTEGLTQHGPLYNIQ